MIDEFKLNKSQIEVANMAFDCCGYCEDSKLYNSYTELFNNYDFDTVNSQLNGSFYCKIYSIGFLSSFKAFGTNIGNN